MEIEFKAKETGARILAAINEKHIPKKKVAKELGISYQALYYYYTGQRIPTLPHMIALSEILQIPVGDLYVYEIRRSDAVHEA